MSIHILPHIHHSPHCYWASYACGHAPTCSNSRSHFYLETQTTKTSWKWKRRSMIKLIPALEIRAVHLYIETCLRWRVNHNVHRHDAHLCLRKNQKPTAASNFYYQSIYVEMYGLYLNLSHSCVISFWLHIDLYQIHTTRKSNLTQRDCCHLFIFKSVKSRFTDHVFIHISQKQNSTHFIAFPWILLFIWSEMF